MQISPHLVMDFPTGLEGAKKDRQAAFLKGGEGVAEVFLSGDIRDGR